ncbi:MAG: hypothetical protein H6597_03365 [Flavobacteriales bacterium]|nr:hypothetical protein [Flavobacteriales bacterium]MCB9193546.1 hypothetical protein [Flavobacteriales bacterium]
MKVAGNMAVVQQRQVALLSVLVFLFMLILAFVPAWRSVQSISWGASVDFHRDAGFVRAILEGHSGEDPVTLGERSWYTPLLSWIEALLVRITGIPVDALIIQAGPFVNLLAPIAFFLMTWSLLGPLRAVMTTAIYLFFFIGQEPSWAVPTYSPRLMAVITMQALFYMDIILARAAFRNRRAWRFVVLGSLAGLTFLGHAAPALLIVLIIVVDTLRQLIPAARARDRRLMGTTVRNALLAGAAFVLAALPLLTTLVGTYGMHVVNRSGFLYTYYALTLSDGRIFLYHNVSWTMALALAGGWLVWMRFRPASHDVLRDWVVLSAVMWAYAYVVAVLDRPGGIELPGTVPSFHYYFYLKAALIVLAGIAVARLWELSVQRLAPRPIDPWTDGRSVVAVLLLVVAACSLQYPVYASRRDLFSLRNRDLAFSERTDEQAAARWIQAHLAWNDVVLCDQELSIWPMLGTARKMVATASTMSNPYRDWQALHAAQRGMLHALTDGGDISATLNAHHVTHLLIRNGDAAGMPHASRWFPREVFRNAAYIVRTRAGGPP